MSCTTTAVTGRKGKFQVGDVLVARTTQWSVNPKLATKTEWGDSDTAGYTARMPGRKDATFTAEGKFDDADEQYDLFQPGDKAVAVLWIRPAETDPVVITALYWDFPCAMNDDFNMSVNVDTQEVVGWTSAWGADGIYYYPGEEGATEHELPVDAS